MLKDDLLKLDLFESNNYFDLYWDLINSYQEGIKICDQYGELHHIIPKFYYKANDLKIDNSSNNLIYLLYRDHVLAHYYLFKALASNNSKYSQSAYFAVYQVFNSKHISMRQFEYFTQEEKEQLFTDIQKDYENLYNQEYSKRMSSIIHNFWENLKETDKEKYELWRLNHKLAANREDVLIKNKAGIRAYWDNITEEKRNAWLANEKKFRDSLTKEELYALYKIGSNGDSCRALRTKCIETGEEFRSQKEAAEWLMTITNWAYSTCKGKIKDSIENNTFISKEYNYSFMRLGNNRKLEEKGIFIAKEEK